MSRAEEARRPWKVFQPDHLFVLVNPPRDLGSQPGEGFQEGEEADAPLAYPVSRLSGHSWRHSQPPTRPPRAMLSTRPPTAAFLPLVAQMRSTRIPLIPWKIFRQSRIVLLLKACTSLCQKAKHDDIDALTVRHYAPLVQGAFGAFVSMAIAASERRD